MKDWKMIAVIATLAFLFSFISGLIGSVGFGIIIIRAIIGAVIFAGIGYGISILLRKFLPELFEAQIESDLVSEENLPQKQEDSVEGKPQIDISIGSDKEDFAMEMAAVDNSGLETNVDSALVDEIKESKSDVDEVAEDSLIPTNIDVLPDMAEFSNSFNSTEDIDGSGSTEAVTLDIMGEEQDPELVAKALRTMVKKDQEG
ncbi:MAG: hypothetical protein J7L71_02120 [Spirochaetaceae bacterium]|nr:hypothetical protein [Spirochaetaceae bacterium]